MTLLDIAKELQSLLARLQDISLWPPGEAAGTLIRLLGTAARGALFKPDRQPEDVELAAAEWRKAPQPWEAAELGLGTTQRAQQTLDAMSPAERVEAERLLEEESDPERKAWILAAIGSGLSGTALVAYARRLASLNPEQVRALDPIREDNACQFVQPDGATCGSSVIVMSRMLNDPAYAMYIQTGIDPRGVLPDATGTSPGKRFGDAALAMHDETNRWWPKFLGTLPGAVDDQMSHPDHPAGVPGTTYRSRLVDPKAPEVTYDAILDAVSRGHIVPLYCYGINQPGTGAHVTLIVGASGDTVTVYDPGRGGTFTMTRDEFNRGDLRGPTTWTTPLSVGLPEE